MVSLPRSEQPHYTSEQLNTIVASAASLVDQGFLVVMGFMGLREGEARHLEVRDVSGDTLVVRDPKTPAGRRILPTPEAVKPVLTAIIGDRTGTELVFDSPRLPGQPYAKGYVKKAITRAVAVANQGRRAADRIPVHSSHALRHSFAAIALSEAGGNLLSVSRALGHARPSITLNTYGHLAPSGLQQLMHQVDDFISPIRLAQSATADDDLDQERGDGNVEAKEDDSAA